MAGAIEAGRAVLRLTLDDKELQAKFSQLENKLNVTARTIRNVGLGLGAAGTAIVAPLSLAVTQFIKVGSELKDMSDRTGIAASNLSELKFAAEQSGTTMKVLETALRTMVQNGFDPANFDQIAAEIASIEDPTRRAARAMEVFGTRSGTQLLPLLRDLPALRAEARALGVTMGDETAAQAEELGDAFDKVKAVVSAAAIAFGSALAPKLLGLLPIMTNAVGLVVKFTQANPQLVVTLGATGAALVALGVAMNVFALGLGKAVAGLKALQAALLFLQANPWVAAITVALGALAYLTDGFGLLADKSEESASKVVATEQQKNTELANLYKQDADNKLAASEEASRKVLERIAADNRRLLSLENQYDQERERQRRERLEQFSDANTKALREAEELSAKVFARLYPQTARRQDKESKIAADTAELERQYKLLNNIDQLRQNDKLRGVLDRADIATSKLAAGRTPLEEEVRALQIVQGDTGKDVRLVVKELEKHTRSLNEIAQAVRDNPGFFVGNN